MELIFDIIADGILDLLGKVIRHSKNPRTQTILDILIASVFLLAEGCMIWYAVNHYRRGNVPVAAVLASGAAIFFLLIGFAVLRRIIKRRKSQ